MGERCATRSYLQLVSAERPFMGRFSTTQLIQGTMQAFLKLTKEYSVSPDDRAFMIHGTKSHANLEAADDDYSILEERFDDETTEITGIADVLECENNWNILVDYKISGSFKVAKALGFTTVEEETGEVYQSGKRKGEPKKRKVLVRREDAIDLREWTLQLNKYRMNFNKSGFKIHKLKIQCCVRDGNTFIARSRGVFRNIYYFDIPILPDEEVIEYFDRKKKALEQALRQGYWKQYCSEEETWGGLKCSRYCEVAEYCPLGQMFKQEKEREDMPIKNVSDIRRLPRVGKIRLGIKTKTSAGKEYPKEVDYFVFDPQTPSELENKRILDEVSKLYGEKPKQIKIMFPVADTDLIFPQWYKRYGKTSSLQCKGDGETAVVTHPEFAEGLEIVGETEEGLKRVKCNGKECVYCKEKQCGMVGTLQVLLPEIPGAGVWQITTGSFNSIVNLNSCIDYVKSVCGRAHMIPLTLERREQTISHDGTARKHYILHLNMDIALKDLQKFALIKPEQIMLEMPAVELDKEDIMYRENAEINVVPVGIAVDEPEKKQQSEIIPEVNKTDMDAAYKKSAEVAATLADDIKAVETMTGLNAVAKSINEQRENLLQEHKDWLNDELSTKRARLRKQPI